MLVIAPTLTTDVVPNLAAHKLHKQTFLPSANNIVKPVQSARIQSNGGFSFKYGYVEIAAKLPTGDWLWPAIWMEAQLSVYGKWPMSGEIDVMESRGNLNYVENGVQIGVQHIGSTLHFGTNATNDAWRTAHSARQKHGLNAGYYVYGLEWTPGKGFRSKIYDGGIDSSSSAFVDYIRFTLDHQLVGVVETGAGFYKRGKFTGPNPWANGSINAPFDEEFFFIFDLAVGGTSGYFPNKGNANGKPWKNASPTAKQDFWNGRAQWLPSWNFDPNAQQTSTFQIDYIRVYAL